jgi:uncharacterized 2Fe-2S/4Fe-4S cluster protein (DUF4445 family)
MTDTVELRIDGEDGQDQVIPATRGVTILDAAQGAGVEIMATCGGRGRCRSCRVKIVDGTVPPPTVQDTVQLGLEAVRERFRLACQTKLVEDTRIRPMPPKSESGYQILGGKAVTTAMALESGVEKRAIVAQPPKSEHHQTSDLDEVFAALGDSLTSREVAPDLVRDLAAKLRARKGQLTATLFRGRLVDIEIGDTSGQAYGMAFDIGTTSIVGSLLDLRTGEELAAVGMINPQAPFGADLMSRIAFAQFKLKNLQLLRGKALNALNDLIKEACSKADVSAAHIYKIVVVGNTCMHHILLGIDVSYLGLAPYAPVIRDAQTMSAAELPLKAVPRAHVCTLPILAGFVGADALACVLSTRLYDSEEIRVMVDIGTNGEMVIGSRDRLVACSAPAGPAFEGAQIRHGMRGALGAIERITIDDDVHCSVIGGEAAVGICGSGLIEACARMSEAGVINVSGALTRDTAALPPEIGRRLIKSEHGSEFVLVWGKDSGKGEDITLTQSDIRQLQLAKSAIFSGVAMLQKEMGVTSEEIVELLLCGGFGNYVDVASAVCIRLLPEMPVERITYFGNAALMGAQMALLSEAEWRRAGDLLDRIEHVALAARPDFQDLFIAGMSFGGPRRKESAAVKVAVAI